MKKNIIVLGSLVGGLVCSSCMPPAVAVDAAPEAGITTNEPTGAKVATSTQWLESNYDLVGFPIYGFYFGKPIYGYSEFGLSILDVNKIVPGASVPSWEPLSTYKGKYYYPSYVGRTATPKKFPRGHQPQLRPEVKVAHRPIIVS